MLELKGKYNTAKVFTDVIDESSISQIIELLNQRFVEGSKIRMMPDVHAGKGCTIGTTMVVTDKICPNLVGVDVGCGVLTVTLGNVDIDFTRLDNFIRENIPSGRNVNPGRVIRYDKIQDITCYRYLKDAKRLERGLRSTGGGNHFIEIDVDDDGCKYLVIHTGSRNLGKQVAEYHQQVARKLHTGHETLWKQQEELIATYKAQGRRSEIQDAIKELHRNFKQLASDVPAGLEYLTGKYVEDYLHDMGICQEYAFLNRKLIADIILDHLGIEEIDRFETVHNYIDLENGILRKGAVSAQKGQRLIIPINMRDGSLICVGKGNYDWNYSAPHGAGRLMSRTAARQTLTVEEFKKTMEGIYSTSIGFDTLDEAPMAYKGMDDIVNNIEPTADIVKVIKPIYNFKAGE